MRLYEDAGSYCMIPCPCSRRSSTVPSSAFEFDKVEHSIHMQTSWTFGLP